MEIVENSSNDLEDLYSLSLSSMEPVNPRESIEL